MAGSRRVELGGSWALVTGASSGLGQAIAERLASSEGANLILTGRRAEALESVSEQVRSRFDVEVEQVVGDLTHDSTIDVLAQRAIQRQVRAVVLNAGVTYYGRHDELPEQQLHQLIDINVRSTLTLLHRLLPMLRHDGGGACVLIVSSSAGIAPVPYQAAYTGSKAFLIAFGQALQAEMRDTSISVSVFAPAGIATRMLETSGLSMRFGPEHPGLMTAKRAAAHAVDAMTGGKGLAVPGAIGKLGLAASRILPRRALLRWLERTYRPETTPETSP